MVLGNGSDHRHRQPHALRQRHGLAYVAAVALQIACGQVGIRLTDMQWQRLLAQVMQECRSAQFTQRLVRQRQRPPQQQTQHHHVHRMLCTAHTDILGQQADHGISVAE